MDDTDEKIRHFKDSLFDKLIKKIGKYRKRKSKKLVDEERRQTGQIDGEIRGQVATPLRDETKRGLEEE